MVQRLENNSQGCATEVEEGTAYQSWDWRSGAKAGDVLQPVALDSSSSWQTVDEGGGEPSRIIPAWSGPWNKNILGGDSRWHQAAWDCRTRMDTLGEYGSILLEELNWFKGILAPWEEAELNFQEFWQLKVKWPFDEGWLKVEENWNTKASLPFDEWTWIHDQDYLKLWPGYEENGIWSEAWKLILIWYFDEGFFGLHEVQWMRFSFVQEEEWKVADFSWLKLHPFNFDSVVFSEFWNLKMFYNFNEGWIALEELLSLHFAFKTTDSFFISESNRFQVQQALVDRLVISELLNFKIGYNFDEGWFKFQESWMMEGTLGREESLKLEELWGLNAEISILDSGLVSEALALMLSFWASDSILLEENYYLGADWFKTENDKLSESFSIVLKSNGYGVNGYGVVGYGV